MAIEGQVNNISDLVPAYPQSDDPVSQGDNHIRNIKKALVETFPNVDGAVNASDEELNQLVGRDLDDLEQRVTNNETNININTGNISDNASDISGLEGRIDALESAGLSPHGLGDHTDVNTAGVKNGQALVYKDGVWVPVDIMGGGTVNFMTQPAVAGDASLNGFQQTYEMRNWNNMGYATQTLRVPAGSIFIMEYFFGQASDVIRVSLDEIKIDGKPLMTQAISMDWDSSGGSVWPGSEGFTPIIVRDSIEVRAYVGQNWGTFSIAGMFSEKS